MQTTTYRVSRLAINEVAMIGLGSLMCLLGLADLAFDSWRAGGLAAAWSQNTVSMPIAVAWVLTGLLLALTGWLVSLKKRGNGLLALDEQGLTHAEGRFRIRRWRWNELSTFKLERRWARREIVFTVPGEAGPITLYEASRRALPDGPLVRIQDIYDAPPEEIAASLNEFRERALGGGAAAGGPQAPEPA